MNISAQGPGTNTIRLSVGGAEQPKLRFVIALSLLAMLGPFSIDTIFPGYPHVAEEFGVAEHQLHQITSLYMAAFAAMSIFHGPLSDAIGRRKVMSGSLILFFIATVGAALAPNFELLLGFRVMQGLSVGGAAIVSRVVIRDLYDGPVAQRLMAQVMLLFLIAPAIAPIAGGFLMLLGHWRWVFVALAAYAVVALLGLISQVPETVPAQKRQAFNPGQIIKSLWNVLRHKQMLLLGVAGVASQAFFMYVAAAPVVVPRFLGLGAQDYWVLFLPFITGMALGNFLIGRLSFSVTRERLISIAFILQLIAHLCVMFAVPALVSGATTPIATLPGMSFFVLVGLGTSLMMAPLQLQVVDLFPHAKGAATSVAALLQLGTNALISGILVPALSMSFFTLGAGCLALSLLGLAAWVIYLLSTRTRR